MRKFASIFVATLSLMSTMAISAYASQRLNRNMLTANKSRRLANGDVEMYNIKLKTGERISTRAYVGVDYDTGASVLCSSLGFDSGISLKGSSNYSYKHKRPEIAELTRTGLHSARIEAVDAVGSYIVDVRCMSYTETIHEAHQANVNRYLKNFNEYWR
jgi:hypothetical protein